MPLFPITTGTVETIYPNSSIQVQFGGGYLFTAAPTAPDQRIFRINLSGMAYLLDPATGKIDLTQHVGIDAGGNLISGQNLGLLEQFYQSVRQYKPFTYNHPIYGPTICTFSKPLAIPRGLKQGFGVVEDFVIELIEHIV
jgi:hypothetical protein